jgi:hypothetical protein
MCNEQSHLKISLRDTSGGHLACSVSRNLTSRICCGQVLTGDKLETAVSIGLSCNLLADSMHLFLLSESVTTSVPQLLRTMLREAENNYSVKLIPGKSFESN